MSLHVLAYNLKRMMSNFGIAAVLEAIRASTRLTRQLVAVWAADAPKRHYESLCH